MKIISKVTLWLGILLVVVGLGAAVWAGWISYTQWLALNALRSSPVDTATLQLLVGGAGLLIGGFLVGLGIGVTPKTPKMTEPGSAAARPVEPPAA
ncbi:MAG: hypothetical protein J0I14_16380 [Propionibacteriaceae bacterium]|jgi:hypothetical protein|nr:hypothetical protein [Propionibacteriaceae bacterium]